MGDRDRLLIKYDMMMFFSGFFLFLVYSAHEGQETFASRKFASLVFFCILTIFNLELFHPFEERDFCIPALLHPGPFTSRPFCIPALLHPGSFASRFFCFPAPLHPDSFASRLSCIPGTFSSQPFCIPGIYI